MLTAGIEATGSLLRCGLFAASFLPRASPNSRETRTQAGMARQHDSPGPGRDGGALTAAISEAVVRLLAETTGRGPTKARTTIDRDLIIVMLQDTLTSGERYLAGSDREEQVLATRRAFQEAMRTDYVAAIEDLAGRPVIAFMSANHIDPDLAAEIFVLAPEALPAA